jgi:hypothetical protein
MLPSCASAQVSVEHPREAVAGRPVGVAAVLDPGVDVVQVELLYRSAAGPDIHALIMAVAGPRRYHVAIPGEHVLPPAVEIVIRSRGRDGQAHLHFRTATEEPYVVPVNRPDIVERPPVPPPAIDLLPIAGGSVVGRRPTLVVSFGAEAPPPVRERVMISIDGVDMSALMQVAGRQIRLRPASALAPGPHEALVTLLDEEGVPRHAVPWPFTIRDYAALQEGSLGTDVSGTYEYATNKLFATDPRWKASANVHVDGRIAEGAFAGVLGADVRYLEQDPGEPPNTTREVDLASHLLTLLYAHDGAGARLDLGEIALSETPLTTGISFARRGGYVAARARQTELHLFSASAVPLFGYENVTGLEDGDRRVHGLSLSQGLLDDRLRVKLTALEGRNAPRRLPGETVSALLPGQAVQQGLQAYSIGSMEAGLEARTYSVLLSSRLFGGRLRAEAEGAWGRRLLLATTEFGAEPDARGWQSDGAWRGRIEGDAWGVHAGAEYRHVGVDFASVANPTLIADREEAAVDLSTSLWLTSWQLLLSRAHDNVRDTGSVPRTTEWKLAPSVTLAVPGLPALSLAYLRSDQTTERPIDLQPREVLTQAGSATLSYATPAWFASVSPSYSVQEAMRPSRETDTRAIAVAAGITPASWLTVSPSYAFTRTRDFSTDTTVDTHVPTLTARLDVVPGLVTLDTQSSYVEMSDSTGTIDTGTIAGLARVTLSLKRFFPGGVSPAVGVRVNYSRIIDEIVTSNSREDYGVFLVFDVFAAIGLLPQPTLVGSPMAGGTLPGVRF